MRDGNPQSPSVRALCPRRSPWSGKSRSGLKKAAKTTWQRSLVPQSSLRVASVTSWGNVTIANDPGQVTPWYGQRCHLRRVCVPPGWCYWCASRYTRSSTYNMYNKTWGTAGGLQKPPMRSWTAEAGRRGVKWVDWSSRSPRPTSLHRGYGAKINSTRKT